MPHPLLGRLNSGVLALVLTLPTVPAYAQEWRLFLEPFYGTAIIDNIEGTGIGTGTRLEGVIDGRLREGKLDDGVAGLGLALERHLGEFYLSATYNWRYRTDWDLTTPTPSIQSITNVFSNVETRSLTMGAGRDWMRGRNRFSATLAAGFVRNRIESEYLEREVPGIRQQQRFEAQHTRYDFAWEAGIGWHRVLGARWLLGLRYRYASLGEFTTDDFVARPAEFSADHRSHDLVLSIGRRRQAK